MDGLEILKQMVQMGPNSRSHVHTITDLITFYIWAYNIIWYVHSTYDMSLIIINR